MHRFYDWMLGTYYGPDGEGGGNGSGATPPGGGSSGSGSGGGDSNPNTGGGGGTPDPNPAGGATLTLTEAQLQQKLDDVAAAARKATEAHFKKLQDDAQAESDRKAAEAKGEWEKLYNTEKSAKETLSSELETERNRNKVLSQSVGNQIDEETKDWPSSIKKNDPGPSKTIEERIAWCNANRDAAKELLAAKTAPNPEMGRGSSPPPGGNGKSASQQYLQSVQYAVPGQKPAGQ